MCVCGGGAVFPCSQPVCVVFVQLRTGRYSGGKLAGRGGLSATRLCHHFSSETATQEEVK